MQRILKLVTVALLMFLTGCGYQGRANMKINTDSSILVETLWLVEVPEGNDKIDFSKEPYNLMRPSNPDGILQIVEMVDREVDGKHMMGWHVKAKMTTAKYQEYYRSLLPPTRDSETQTYIDSLTGETIVIEPDESIPDYDPNDGYIHTTNIANFCPIVQVQTKGFNKTYKISYVGILNSVPEEYQEFIKDGFTISIAPCGTVLDHNATSVSENGIYTWENEDINNAQIIFSYTDLYPIITYVSIAGVTIAAYLIAYALIRFWTRPSQIIG